MPLFVSKIDEEEDEDPDEEPEEEEEPVAEAPAEEEELTAGRIVIEIVVLSFVFVDSRTTYKKGNRKGFSDPENGSITRVLCPTNLIRAGWRRAGNGIVVGVLVNHGSVLSQLRKGILGDALCNCCRGEVDTVGLQVNIQSKAA